MQEATRSTQTGKHYISTIITKDGFTDKPFIAVFLISALLYFSAIGLFVGRSNVASSAGKKLLASLDFKTGLVNCMAPVLLVFLMTECIFLSLFTIPVVTIHLAFWMIFIGGPIGAVMFFLPIHALFAIIAIAMLAIFYFLNFREIKKQAPRVSTIAGILLANNFSFILYLFLSYLCLSFVLSIVVWCKTAVQIMPSSNEHYLLAMCMTVLSSVTAAGTLIFLGYCSDVYFARIVFAHIRNRAAGSPRTNFTSAITRVFRSFGTIYIGTLLYLVILLARMLARTLFERVTRNNNNEGSVGLMIIAYVLYFVVSCILYLLEIAVDTVNTHVMVYSALFGTGYSKSMKGASDAIKAQTSYRYALLFSSIVFIAVSQLVMPVLIYGSAALATTAGGAAKSLVFGASELALYRYTMFIVLCLIAFDSIMSGFLSFELINSIDPQLIQTVYPKLAATS
ncbi:hypothetical protein NEHOM01_0617 [Nematocida homosporus]|uniref:uncharacterized protein n=1 Tax=Nematocida homosporus TaxID=1912981 RepID=UPI00221E5BC4|nr:uncharacterized protein NEHOM01_0617 [Nematocida homosporus]KAI5185112.1 hypothetical protein NEHOM01_0617 [Nematocida homosporus]